MRPTRAVLRGASTHRGPLLGAFATAPGLADETMTQAPIEGMKYEHIAMRMEDRCAHAEREAGHHHVCSQVFAASRAVRVALSAGFGPMMREYVVKAVLLIVDMDHVHPLVLELWSPVASAHSTSVRVPPAKGLPG